MIDDNQLGIYRGQDCCEHKSLPGRNIYITPNTKTIEPLEIVDLSVVGFSGDCDPVCLSWRIISGWGQLGYEFGDRSSYVGPGFDELCEGGAVVGLMCGGEIVSRSYFSTNSWTEDTLAYMRFSPRPQLFVFPKDPFEPLVRIDKEPYEGWPGIWQEQYYVNEHRCNGERVSRYMWAYRNLEWHWDLPRKVWYRADLGHRVLMSSKQNDGVWFGIPYTWGSDKVFDIRSERMKEGGCCPAALFFRD